MFVAVKKKKSYGWIWWIHIFVLRLCQPQITSFSFSIFWQWDFVFRSTSGRANYNNWEQFLLILLGSTILLLEIEDSIYCRWVFWFWKIWFAIPSWYWQFSASLPMTAKWMFSRHDQLLHSLLLVGESQLVPLPPGKLFRFTVCIKFSRLSTLKDFWIFVPPGFPRPRLRHTWNMQAGEFSSFYLFLPLFVTSNLSKVFSQSSW